MNSFLIISTPGWDTYALFYWIAILLFAILFIFQGIRRTIPLYLLLLITVTSLLVFIVGNKFLAVSPREWSVLFSGGALTHSGGRTVLGGLLGLTLGSALAMKWLKSDGRIFDFMAVGIPVAIAFSRIGCLLSGCCFGTLSELPWAISYPPDSHAFHAQVAGGLLEAKDYVSLPIHPVQVYETILCIGLAIILWRRSKYWKAKGNNFLFALFLYGCARLVLEFFRDPHTNFYVSGSWIGLKIIQWILLLAVIHLGLIIWSREKRWKPKPDKINNWDLAPWRPFTLLLFLIISFSFLFGWFNMMERVTFLTLLIPALIVTLRTLSQKMAGLRLAIGTGLLAMVCLLFLGQTYIPDNDSTRVKYFEVGTGWIFGNYHDFSAKAVENFDCEGDVYYALEDKKDYTYDVVLGGFEFSYHERIGRFRRLDLKLCGYYGFEDIQEIGMSGIHRQKIYDLNPSFSYNGSKVGVDLGFHFGNIAYTHIFDVTNAFARTIYNSSDGRLTHHYHTFLPELGIRIGPQHIFFFEAQYARAFPFTGPATKFALGIGSGLNRLDGTKVGIGLSTGGLYVLAAIPVKERYVLQGFFTENFKKGYENSYTVGLAFNYRFKYQVKPMK